MELRTQHGIDVPQPTSKGLRQKTISNWLHHWNPEHPKGNGRDPGDSESWSKNERGIVPRELNVPNWPGPNEFAFQSRKGPLEKFFRDSSDAGNRSTYGVRRSDMPHVWANFKALDCSASDGVVSGDGLSVTHEELWPAVKVRLTDEVDKLKEDLILDGERKAEWPEYFEWTLKIAPGCTADVVDNILSIRDSDGVVRIETRAPWGEDSATTAPTMNGKQHIRCTFTIEGERFGLLVVRLTPNPGDTADAIGDVRLDPTTVISGTTDIEDALLINPTSSHNYGSHTAGYTFLAGYITSQLWASAYRVATSSFPAGTITGFRFDYTRWVIGVTESIGVTARAAPFTDANTYWVEGTAWNAVQAGSCTFTRQVFNITSWDDSGTPTLDPRVDGTHRVSEKVTKVYPGDLVAGYKADSWDLDPNWVTQWRDGGWLNSGFITRSDSLPGPNNSRVIAMGSEHATASYRPTFTVTYSTGPTTSPYYSDMMMRSRRR